jgi:DNA polymerase epsilon subunit 1
VKEDIVNQLEVFLMEPECMRTPLIYHLDVSAMYPNIILTNRLQPDAIVTDSTCASCDYNEGPLSDCQRRLPWLWRGEYFPLKRPELLQIRTQLSSESFAKPNEPSVPFLNLAQDEQDTLVKKRTSEYARKVYSKVHETKILEKEAIVCQRENPTFIQTVRVFRDRRYVYKSSHKAWKAKLDAAVKEQDSVAEDEARKMVVVFDSLQLAHKCILNSFYGYVMRKGARWYSMEMAGIVCYTGSKIIQLARQIVGIFTRARLDFKIRLVFRWSLIQMVSGVFFLRDSQRRSS